VDARAIRSIEQFPVQPLADRDGSSRPVVQFDPQNIAAFPQTRYYGSKRKLLPWIYDCIGDLNFETALDVFGGTASVSLLIKAMGKRVTYHDGFKFNEDVGRTILANEIALGRTEVADFIASVSPQRAVISDLFPGVYYTKQENAWLDGFAIRLSESKLPRKAKSLLRYLVYQACLKKRPFNLFHRANLHLRTNSGVERTFGNYATWQRSFAHHMFQAYDELIFDRCCDADSVVLPSGNAASLEPGYDLVYLDPPYLSLERRYNRDDYWRRYHFLEGFARYRGWRSRVDQASDIKLLRQPTWMKEWSDESRYTSLLFALVEHHRRSIVVLSYVDRAYPDADEIRTFFAKTFRSIEVHARKHSHALRATPRRELLFIGRP